MERYSPSRMSQKLLGSCLIIGFGNMGQRYAKLLTNLCPNLSIYVLTKNPSHSQSIEFSHINFIAHLDQLHCLIPKFCIICTPSSQHLLDLLSVSKYSIPVLIEKPICSGSQMDFELLRTKLIDYDWNNTVVAYLLRHSIAATQIQNIIREKTLGTLIDAQFYCGSWLPDWRNGSSFLNSISAKPETGGGVLLELSHEIDFAIYVLGQMSLSYGCICSDVVFNLRVEEQSTIILKTKNNRSCIISLNFCSQPSCRQYSIRFSKGQISWDLVNRRSLVTSFDDTPIVSICTETIADLFLQQLKSFLSFVYCCDRSPCLCSFSQSMDVVSLINEVKSFS